MSETQECEARALVARERDWQALRLERPELYRLLDWARSNAA